MVNCPLWQSKRIYQSSHRGTFERRILAMVFVRPFCCESCDFRFYRWSFSANPHALRQISTH